MFLYSDGYESVPDNLITTTTKSITKYEMMPLRYEIVIKDIYIILIQFFLMQILFLCTLNM